LNPIISRSGDRGRVCPKRLVTKIKLAVGGFVTSVPYASGSFIFQCFLIFNCALSSSKIHITSSFSSYTCMIKIWGTDWRLLPLNIKKIYKLPSNGMTYAQSRRNWYLLLICFTLSKTKSLKS
jgi:hypothetical protein